MVAVGAFTLFPENPVALATFGFFYSIPCFYYIVTKPQYATSGRFVLLTYNLTCLYWYVNDNAFVLATGFLTGILATMCARMTFRYRISRFGGRWLWLPE